MAAAAHSNVGLFHATMAVFNAWCDRMPLLLIGATGPVDASDRRPWIEWIHTARDQGAIVRNYTKWDDQPASPAAAREAILRAAWMAEASPKAPVYVNLDVGLQEAPFEHPLPAVDAGATCLKQARERRRNRSRSSPISSRAPGAQCSWRAACRAARTRGRASRARRRVGARVVTDLKVGRGLPDASPAARRGAGHLCRAGVAASHRRGRRRRELRLGGPRGNASRGFRKGAAGRDHRADFAGSPAAQRLEHGPPGIAGRGFPDCRRFRFVVPALLRAIGQRSAVERSVAASPKPSPLGPALARGPITMAHLAAGLREAVGARDVSFTHLPLGWDGALWDFGHPLDFLGSDGGGGIGGGPGISVGAALALRAAAACRSASGATAIS
jgi:hypothetical protein